MIFTMKCCSVFLRCLFYFKIVEQENYCIFSFDIHDGKTSGSFTESRKNNIVTDMKNKFKL